MMSDADGVRLQKVLSKAGVASRRAAEDLIAQGRVSVNGDVVHELGRRVDPENAVIHVDGVRVVIRSDLVYLALNKPRGMHSTMSDERGRSCVVTCCGNGRSGCSTSAGWTRRPRACCCSPMTVNWRTD